jgi:hypothetical protein
MKSTEFLIEAEQNVAKKKIDQQLDQLSDQEIDALLSMITTSLEEGRYTYDPLAGPAPGQSQTPKPQQQKKSEPQKQQPKPKSEVKAYVDDLGAKEKEALKVVLQKEKTQRAETGEKVSAPPKPASKLKNILGAVLIAAVAAGVIGNMGGDKTPSAPVDKPVAAAQASQPETKTSKWETSSWESKIDDQRQDFITLNSDNKVDLDFPYGKTNLKMYLVFEKGKFSGISLMTKGQLYDAYSSDLDQGKLKVKFDNGPVETVYYLKSRNPSQGQSEAYIPGNEIGEEFFQKLKNSNKVKIQLSYYQAGDQVFEFDSKGLAEILEKGKK